MEGLEKEWLKEKKPYLALFFKSTDVSGVLGIHLGQNSKASLSDLQGVRKGLTSLSWHL